MTNPIAKKHHPDDLIQLFNRLFFERYQTMLVYGDSEPLYIPASGQSPARIYFAHGYFASALHEIAHWCIAGRQRRSKVDYGYWYQGNGRNAAAQQAFESVEAKPQAMEWIFSVACGFRFQLSVDNLSNVAVDYAGFETKVFSQVERYVQQGLPTRAEVFFTALADFYQQSASMQLTRFSKRYRRIEDMHR